MAKKPIHKGTEAMPSPSVINIYHPYRALFPLDPRRVYSIGDQVVSEHIFGFHSTESDKGGFQSVLSKISIEHSKNTIVLEPCFRIRRSDGSVISLTEIAHSIRSSFEGTAHSPYSNLLRGVSIEGSKIVISLSKLPVNIRHLFTIPDFALFETAQLPIGEGRAVPTTGPYSFESAGERDVWLRANPYYPSQLRANSVERVHYTAYKVSELDPFLSSLDPRKDHLIYLPGYYLTQGREDLLKAKGYKLEVNPSELVTFLSFRTSATPADLGLISTQLGNLTERIKESRLPGQAAYSLMPSDRPYGITKNEFEKLIAPPQSGIQLSRSYVLGIIDSDLQNEFIRLVVDRLKDLPGIHLKIYEAADFQKMFNEADVYLDTIGISPADPLGHFSFLQASYAQFAKALSPEHLTSIALTENDNEFITHVKSLEKSLIQAGLVIPLAHFPGVVIEAPNFEKDESLAWNWGTQAWTYKIR